MAQDFEFSMVVKKKFSPYVVRRERKMLTNVCYLHLVDIMWERSRRKSWSSLSLRRRCDVADGALTDSSIVAQNTFKYIVK